MAKTQADTVNTAEESAALSHSASQGPQGLLGQRAGWHETKRDVVRENREAPFMSNYALTSGNGSLILGDLHFCRSVANVAVVVFSVPVWIF